MTIHSYQETIDDIIWAIEAEKNQFSLTFIRCNYPKISQEIMEEVEHQRQGEIYELKLDKTAKNLYHEIENISKSKEITSLVIIGLEEVSDLDTLLTSANLQRERFRADFQFPIFIWINDFILKKLNELAKDFQTWGGVALNVNVTLEDVTENFQQKIDELFNKIIESGYSEFLSNELILGASYQVEIDSVIKDFESLGENLSPEFEGDILFIKGRSFYQTNKFLEAVQVYHKCFELWQQNKNILPVKIGILQFHLGLAYYRLREKRNQDKQQNLQYAKTYLENCITIFERNKKDELVGKFINCLGEILRDLQEWKALEQLVNKSIILNKNSPAFLAESYSFWVEMSLRRSHYQDALRWVKLACKLTQMKGVYLLLLALVKEYLGQHQAAIQCEAQGIDCKVKTEQRFYFIELLERLSQLYFDNKKYLASYQTKLNIQSLKQQYGLIAFIGAGRIKANKDTPTNLSQEIDSSGRQEDVNNLVQRISRIDNKVTIIYGQSGVGKSSIIEAGLIPALQQKHSIKNYTILPINLRFYNNWKQELEELLIRNSPIFALSKPKNDDSYDYTTEQLIELLKNNDQNNILTILIFDQFEEFFFFTKTQREIAEFFDFFAACLKVVYLKVIFSLREDYIHLLLRGTRHLNLDAINNNILDKNIIYYLGNLSPTTTKDLVTQLTHRCDFFLTERLINELVRDLTTELGEIRPIELQIIGSQVQTEEITTFEIYKKYGDSRKERTEKLVNNYLKSVIKSCGEENKDIAELILYLLTNENNTRPLKTKSELEKELRELRFKTIQENLTSLNLVLNILQLSGLLLLIPEQPEVRYQLVHDYLIKVIRQQQEDSFAEQIKHKKQAEQFYNSSINSLIRYASLLIRSNKEFDGLLEGIKAAKQLQQQNYQVTPETQTRLTLTLMEGIYNIKEKNRLIGHQSSVNIVVFSPDGQILASASHDKTIKLWDQQGRLLQTLTLSAPAHLVAFSPNSQTLVCTSDDKMLQLWSLQGKLLQTLTLNAPAHLVAFSPDGKIFASANRGKNIKLWNRQGKLLRTLTLNAPAHLVAFSSDNQLLASASRDKTIRLWCREGQLLQTIGTHQDTIESIAFSPDNQLIASASRDKTIKLWSRDGQLLQTIEAHDKPIRSVVFSPDGQTLASASSDQTIKLWRRDGQLLQTLTGHCSEVRRVVFSPDAQTLASASSDKTIKLWNPQGIRLQTLCTHRAWIRSVIFSPDGCLFASASDDKMIILWRRDGRLLHTIKAHEKPIRSVAFSPDGQILASASSDQTIKLWNREGQLIREIRDAHQDVVVSVAFSPNGQILASASFDKTIKLWNREGQLVREIPNAHQQDVRSVVFSPDAQTLASASSDQTVKLWNQNGQLLHTIKAHEKPIRSVVFSPDGQTLASASSDKTIKLWNRDGKLLQTLEGHDKPTYIVAFSPDGQTLASTSSDKTIKLWSRNGQLLQTLYTHQDVVTSVTFSPDGQTLVSASGDTKIIIWNLNLDDLVTQGCNWVRNYVRYSAEMSEEERGLCD